MKWDRTCSSKLPASEFNPFDVVRLREPQDTSLDSIMIVPDCWERSVRSRMCVWASRTFSRKDYEEAHFAELSLDVRFLFA